jgi:NAD(P)-dependent dehydrogenase (short-subunit alcohol dehydrogenase family)
MYVITGGLGGIGVEVAKHLLREHQARVLLIGRTLLPDRSAWPSHLAKGDELARRIESLIALERLGGTVAYSAVDVGDFALLKRAVDDRKSVGTAQCEA